MANRAKPNGFSLIELVVASAIASMISLFLYQTLSQMKRSTVRMHETLDTYGDLLSWYSQLEEDFLGLFVVQAEQKKAAAVQGKGSDSKPTAGAQQQKKQDAKDEALALEMRSNNGFIDRIEFVTTHGLRQSPQEPQVPVVVTYTCQPTSSTGGEQKLAALFRAERPSRKFQEKKDGASGKSYQMIDSLVRCSVVCLVVCEGKLFRVAHWNHEMVKEHKQQLPNALEWTLVRKLGATEHQSSFIIPLVGWESDKEGAAKASAPAASEPPRVQQFLDKVGSADSAQGAPIQATGRASGRTLASGTFSLSSLGGMQ